jgi:glycosyltransferase 2 family protein
MTYRSNKSTLSSLEISNKAIRWLSISVGVAAGIYFLFLVLTDWKVVVKVISNIPFITWVTLIAMTIVAISFRFVRWHFLLKYQKLGIPVKFNFTVYLAGFALITTPGHIGENVRALFLKPLNVKYSQSFATFLSERVLDLIVLNLVSAITVMNIPGYQDLFIIFVLATLVVILLIYTEFAQYCLKIVPIKKLQNILTNLHVKVKILLQGKQFFYPFIATLIAWSLQAVAFIIIINTMELNINTSLTIGIYCISILVGAFSFMPGGIGTTEAAMTFMLINIGVDPATAVAASLVSRVTTLWVAVALGIIMMLKLGIIKNKSHI